MATFKAGQRVRARHNPRRKPDHARILGLEGIILRRDGGDLDTHAYWVYIPSRQDQPEWWLEACELEPLSDPRAEEFIADMERFSVASRPKEIA